jgi:hypothetical protein
MKKLTLIILAGAALALCGCTTADGPIFAPDPGGTGTSTYTDAPYQSDPHYSGHN